MMQLQQTKKYVKVLYRAISGKLQPGKKIIFSDYNRQLRFIINNSIRHKIYFLPDFSCFYDSFNSLINKYKKYFREKNFDYFVINTLSRNDISKYAALVAAKEVSPFMQTIYLEHGDTGFNDPSIVWRWLHYCDYYYTSNIEAREYVNSIKKQYKEQCFVMEWKRPIPKLSNRRGNYILFAPGFYNSELFIGLTSDPIKYRGIKTMLKWLNKNALEEGHRIVYADASSSHIAKNPVLTLIKDYEAVEYMNNCNFNKLLSKAIILVTDCVSTPMYDAADMGISSLCMYWAGGALLREGVRKQFGNSIQLWKNGRELVDKLSAHIKNFNRVEIKHRPDKMPWE